MQSRAYNQALQMVRLFACMRGVKPCKVCVNCYARTYDGSLRDGEVTIRCVDPALFVQHSDSSLYAYYDTIVAARPRDRPDMEKAYGIKYNPYGMMHTMRRVYQPVSHTLRDWMHMLVSGGVANTQAALLLVLLMSFGVRLETVGAFVASVVLPWRHGKTSGTWVSRQRLGKTRESLASFASVMLSLIPILACFLEEIFPGDDDHPIREHKECWNRLNHMISILRTGPERAMEHLDELRIVIGEWATLFERLYPGASVKPKFHNLVIHLIQDVLRVGKLLSCFVTERKHRSTKRTALFTFRYIDNTVVKNMLNTQCEQIRGGSETLFRKQYLVNPQEVCCFGAVLYTSNHIVTPCGALRIGDVACVDDGRVGRLHRFWSNDDATTYTAQVDVYQACGDGRHWDICNSQSTTILVDQIIDAVMWFRASASVIRVILPFGAPV